MSLLLTVLHVALSNLILNRLSFSCCLYCWFGRHEQIASAELVLIANYVTITLDYGMQALEYILDIILVYVFEFVFIECDGK